LQSHLAAAPDCGAPGVHGPPCHDGSVVHRTTSSSDGPVPLPVTSIHTRDITKSVLVGAHAVKNELRTPDYLWCSCGAANPVPYCEAVEHKQQPHQTLHMQSKLIAAAPEGTDAVCCCTESRLPFCKLPFMQVQLILNPQTHKSRREVMDQHSTPAG
jgi:hypothetical protein